VKILWDINIKTDHLIEHRQPDIVVVEKDNKMAYCSVRRHKSRREGAGEDRQIQELKSFGK